VHCPAFLTRPSGTGPPQRLTRVKLRTCSPSSQTFSLPQALVGSRTSYPRFIFFLLIRFFFSKTFVLSPNSLRALVSPFLCNLVPASVARVQHSLSSDLLNFFLSLLSARTALSPFSSANHLRSCSPESPRLMPLVSFFLFSAPPSGLETSPAVNLDRSVLPEYVHLYLITALFLPHLLLFLLPWRSFTRPQFFRPWPHCKIHIGCLFIPFF